MECPRCDGWLVSTGTGFHNDPYSLSCVNCGNMTDPTIVKNRALPTREMKTRGKKGGHYGSNPPSHRSNPEKEYKLHIPSMLENDVV